MNKIRTFLFLIVLVSQSMTHAAGSNASTASINLSSAGMSKIVGGSADLLTAGGQLFVASVQVAGEITYITIKTVASAATMTLSVATKVIATSLVTAGQSIQVSATAAGQFLYASGKLIAFIPNAIGKNLVYSRVIH